MVTVGDVGEFRLGKPNIKRRMKNNNIYINFEGKLVRTKDNVFTKKGTARVFWEANCLVTHQKDKCLEFVNVYNKFFRSWEPYVTKEDEIKVRDTRHDGRWNALIHTDDESLIASIIISNVCINRAMCSK